MSIKSLFQKYILPKEIDFVAMLQEQSDATHQMVEDLHICCTESIHAHCQAIIDDEHKTKKLKNTNMEELLKVFITPIDRESIYRAITQLDWITLSIKHFILETKAYKIENLEEYRNIFDLILDASSNLNRGFRELGKQKHAKVSRLSEKTREATDKISQEYIEAIAKLSNCNDIKKMFINKEILTQLREIGRRFHISANTLQDIVVKMD